MGVADSPPLGVDRLLAGAICCGHVSTPLAAVGFGFHGREEWLGANAGAAAFAWQR